MAKSLIIKNLIENKISLEECLLRVRVLAHSVGNKSLEDWAAEEISGYKKTDSIPAYRVFESVDFLYTGVNGNFQMTKMPLPGYYFEKEHLEKIRKFTIKEGIQVIEKIVAGEEDLKRDITYLAGDVLKNTNGQIQCFSIYQLVPRFFYVDIFNAVKEMSLSALLKLEDTYGCLDEYDVKLSCITDSQINATNLEINNDLFGKNGEINIVRKHWYENYWVDKCICIIAGILIAYLASFITK